ncbi:MAG: class I SAM-dependent methyltransferase [Hyphomicrobiaceae bacterium]
MRLRTSFIHPLAAICLALMPAAASAQQPVEAYKPQVGQHGKDVIWVPTPQALVDKMLDMAKVGPGDHVIDLGSGDGRTVITAAKRGAIAHGIEYNPEMVELSKHNAVKAGVADKATFAKADIFESDFSKATVISLFLLPRLNLKLRPTILRMAPGTRIVSNSFDMDDWRPDQTAYVTDGCTGYCKAYLWIVPEKVAGSWQLGAGVLALEQKFQVVTGTLTVGNVVAPLKDVNLKGDRIAFTAGATRYTGQAKGGSMEGTSVSGGQETKWQATRK